MNREEILSTLRNFKDECGTSYADAEPQAMFVIERALYLYFGTIAKINAVGNPNPLTPSDIIKAAYFSQPYPWAEEERSCSTCKYHCWYADCHSNDPCYLCDKKRHSNYVKKSS